MTLKEKITKDFIVSMKEKDTVRKNLLSVVRGEIQSVEKNLKVSELSDTEVLKILNKTAKSLKEMTESGDNQSKEELSIIENYLPKQMDEKQIKEKIIELIDSGVNHIGGIMKEFSKLPADKKLVSQIFRENS